jgi:hypothetical protein
MSYRGYRQAYPQSGRCQGCSNVSYDNYSPYEESRYVTPRHQNYQDEGYVSISHQGHEHTFIPNAHHHVPCPPNSVSWGNAFGGGCTGLGGVTMADGAAGAMSPRSRNRGPTFSPCQQGGYPQRGCGQNYGNYRS